MAYIRSSHGLTIFHSFPQSLCCIHHQLLMCLNKSLRGAQPKRWISIIKTYLLIRLIDRHDRLITRSHKCSHSINHEEACIAPCLCAFEQQHNGGRRSSLCAPNRLFFLTKTVLHLLQDFGGNALPISIKMHCAVRLCKEWPRTRTVQDHHDQTTCCMSMMTRTFSQKLQQSISCW